MTNAQGNHLAPGICQGIHLWSQSKSLLWEVHQERPDEASWTIWRRFLNSFSTYHGYFHSSVGSWLHPAAKLRRAWPYIFSPSGNTLYVRSGLQYEIYPFVRTQYYSYDMTVTVTHQPIDGIPIDCTETSAGWRIPGFPAPVIYNPPVPTSPTFDDYIDQQP